MPLKVVYHDLPKPPTPQERAEGLARLLARSQITEAGCWEWARGRNRLGYGQLVFAGGKWMAHRLAWVLTKGAIPPGMFVCHKCDNPSCVNPAHLFVGDHTANQRDMIAKNRHSKGSQTHCKRGHPLEGDNVGKWRDTHRQCVICARARQRMLAGWPEDLAYSTPIVPRGKRPMAKSWKRMTTSTVSEVK
jgi:hypothetical protein